MIHLKNSEEIECCRLAADLVSSTLGILAPYVKPGITPLELDRIAEIYIRDMGGIPAFKGLYGFPNTLCISPNDQVVHGIPNNQELCDGDIVSIDCGVKLHDFLGDQAFTFAVGSVSESTTRLLRITRECLDLGIAQAKSGNRIGDISHAIQQHAESAGYGVVRELVGHGLGRQLHEKPEIPNYGKKGHGIRLADGMVLAIEPMINAGTKSIRHEQDGWTVRTADGSLSAHYEHNIVLINGQCTVLTTFRYVDEALRSSKQK
ncbi:MAG: type I methionyl aminopeptidase [Sphingomonadales bacterium]|nr:type I methionyl aminopeptidase [Sphingomonadales bacterium]